MNGRALAAGGWRSDARSSMLLAALLDAEHGRPDESKALLSRGRRPTASAAATPTQVMFGRVTAILADQAGDRTVGSPGRHRRAAVGRRRRRPGSDRSKPDRRPPTTVRS